MAAGSRIAAFDAGRRAGGEIARLHALRRLQILDTAPEKPFCDLVQTAVKLCHTQMAMLGFIDRHRIWFKAAVGTSLQEVPREGSFCSYAAQQGEFCLIPDAKAHPLFAKHAAVAGAASIRFYAGAVLRNEQGHCLGTLCVVDRVLHPDFSPRDRQNLERLARIAMDKLELRLALIEHARDVRQLFLLEKLAGYIA